MNKTQASNSYSKLTPRTFTMNSCTKLLNERKNEKSKGIADVLKKTVEETASIKDVPCRVSFFLYLSPHISPVRFYTPHY
ncbi:hypothetical protein TNCT_141751 [Trichonephila clavata]|uniref:Uncharacterized protein n=1 Tax=Trichonephila clavata TaxID=2740835 RepID=A0A8X6IVC3_TRICU|nr:hypothetical protein TNCT_141751 [Trichonephila clavata]